MESRYRADAQTVTYIVIDLLDSASIEVQDAAAVGTAIQRYAEGDVDLHDCLIVALGEQRKARVVTIDAKAAKRLGMQLVR